MNFSGYFFYNLAIVPGKYIRRWSMPINKSFHTAAGLLVMALLNVPVYAENKGGRPGDEFRETAKGYEDNASRAVRQATSTRGPVVNHYLELSSIYREMATIKRHAANLADHNRWDDINWDRYKQLEIRRDELLGQVDRAQHARKSGDKSHAASPKEER